MTFISNCHWDVKNPFAFVLMLILQMFIIIQKTSLDYTLALAKFIILHNHCLAKSHHFTSQVFFLHRSLQKEITSYFGKKIYFLHFGASYIDF